MCRTHVLLLALQQAAGALLTCWLLYADPASPRGLRAGRELVLMVFLVQPIPSAHVVCHVQLLGQEGSKRQAVGGEHAEEGRTAGSVAARVSFHPLRNCWHFSFLPTESILLIVWA